MSADSKVERAVELDSRFNSPMGVSDRMRWQMLATYVISLEDEAHRRGAAGEPVR